MKHAVSTKPKSVAQVMAAKRTYLDESETENATVIPTITCPCSSCSANTGRMTHWIYRVPLLLLFIFSLCIFILLPLPFIGIFSFFGVESIAISISAVSDGGSTFLLLYYGGLGLFFTIFWSAFFITPIIDSIF